MKFEKSCGIDMDHKPFGILRWGRDGLRVFFQAESFSMHDGVFRIYAYSMGHPEKKLLIGVPEPENEILILKKGFSDYELKFSGIDPEEIDKAEAVFCVPGQTRKTEPGIAGWEHTGAEAAGISDRFFLNIIGAKQILRKTVGSRTFIAEEVLSKKELLLASAVSLAVPVKLDDRWHIIFEIKNGTLEKAVNINLLMG